MFYLNNNKDIKKQVKQRVKKILEEMEAQSDNDGDEEEEKKVEKKRKKSESQPKKLTEKKTKRKKTEENEDDNEEEEIPKKKRKVSNDSSKRKMSTNSKKSNTKKNKKDDEDIDLNSLKFLPRPKGNNNAERKPFSRIDNAFKEKLPTTLKDNSYEFFMRKTGDSFGQVANDKLKITRGKDFKKEKTKFKNKTSAGGFTISQTVRSIPLDDSD